MQIQKSKSSEEGWRENIVRFDVTLARKAPSIVYERFLPYTPGSTYRTSERIYVKAFGICRFLRAVPGTIPLAKVSRHCGCFGGRRRPGRCVVASQDADKAP